MRKYLVACDNDTKKAMTLYRYNLYLSQQMFTVVSCFEVALRNCIDRELMKQLGNDWLRNAILPNGVFYYDRKIERTKKIIDKVYKSLMLNGLYTHPKLLSEMEFGVWKYMFSNVQYRLTGQILLKVFPYKPRSSSMNRYDNTYVFNELDHINNMRNRIAHHKPICFFNGNIDTSYALNRYLRMNKLFSWMGIDNNSLL